MLIKEGHIINNNDSAIEQFSNDQYEIYYKGLVFVSGKKQGDESIEYIINNIIKSNTPTFSPIFGNYFIYLVDKASNTQYFFTDNSGIFKCFKYKDYISTSFLELIDHVQNFTINDLNADGIIEFFRYGFPYFNQTLLKGIERIDGKYYYKTTNKKTEKLGKGLSQINEAGDIDIKQFFNDLIYATSNKNTSLDLTGGFDSRLILSFFSKAKSKFELAISGLKNNADIKIANKIVAKNNNAFYPTYHTVSEKSIHDLESIFKLSDGQIDVIDYHRNHQLNSDRKKRNIELQISGVGGELYKDFWWLQDFPFYNKRKADIEKLYKLRIESSKIPNKTFGEQLRKQAEQLKAKTIEKLAAFKLDTNTKTYDNIYFNYKMKTNAGVYISLANNYFVSYAPLLEIELVKMAFQLKRSTRFYNNFHRKIISENAPELSKIRTSEGISCSNSIIYKTTDFAFYVADKVQRLVKQMLRKAFNKTYLQDSPNDNKIYSVCKKSQLFADNLKLLQKHKLISSSVKSENIPNRMVGKIITLGLLIQKLED